MKGVCVYIELEKCVANWATHRMGNPIRFIKKSHLSAMLVQLRTKWPDGVPPQLRPKEGEVSIVVPDDPYRRAERYNYLSRHARHELAMAITDLFELALWQGCAPFFGVKKIDHTVSDWCRDNGIVPECHEAVKQRFYRIRKRLRAQGIMLGRRNAVRKSIRLRG